MFLEHLDRAVVGHYVATIEGMGSNPAYTIVYRMCFIGESFLGYISRFKAK